MGNAVEITPDTGYFWFFNQENVELLVKVLDGCMITDHWWVFAGGLTDVEVTLRVTDTQSGPGEDLLQRAEDAVRAGAGHHRVRHLSVSFERQHCGPSRSSASPRSRARRLPK